MQEKKLLLAGSHAATTVIAVVEEILLRKLNWDIYFIGKKWATEEKKSYTLEYKELPKLGVNFLAVESGKIQTKFTRHTIFSILKIPFGFFHVFFLILKLKPTLTLSFGGAAGALVSFWSWFFKIPVIIHEQTTSAGRANIYSSKFAKVVAISREESRKYFFHKNIVLIGDPISKEIIKHVKDIKNMSVKTIFITGGSRGSKWINEAIYPLISKLKKYKIIWQCGEEHVNKYQVTGDKCQVLGQIEPKEYADILSQADIVIARAGSNTVSELIALKKPCILIPIPWSYLDEQTKNAEYIKNLGLARIIPQNELKAQRLLFEINNLIKDYSKIIKNCKNIVSPDLSASTKVVDLLLSCM